MYDASVYTGIIANDVWEWYIPIGGTHEGMIFKVT